MEGLLDAADRLDARQFQIAVKRLADSLGYGTDRSPFLGSGIEYVQSRPYQWGDPIRAIDWRVTARTRRVHVKEYEAPKRMPVWILMDTSASMTASSHRRSKYALAVHIAGGLAFACFDRVSPVGVMTVGGRELRTEPSLSAARAMEWLHRLRRYRFDESTNIGRRVAELAPTLSSRCMAFLLSDLHDPSALAAIRQMGQRHDVAVLHLVDPAERGMKGVGFVRSIEAETGREFIVHGRALTDPTTTAQQVRRGGVDYLRIDTDQPFIASLRQFLRNRSLLGRGAR